MAETEVGHYHIEQEIGRGGMGVVYRARDQKLERTVAIKSLTQNFAHDGDARARILREAKAAASLEHPYICKVFETLEAAEGVYVVMEYVEGRTLDGVDLDLEQILRIGREIAEALQEAHTRGIVHRDLKPSNVMLTRSGHIKIMDFGLAKLLPKDGSGEGDETATSTLTRRGEIVGSTPYMSPEQLRGQEVDTRSDLFSFGVLLYELITRHRPFDGQSLIEIASSILSDEPEPMTRYRRGVPEDLERIVKRLLAKDPLARSQSISEVLRDLTRIPLHPSPPHRSPPWFSRAWALTIAAAAVLALSFLLWRAAGWRAVKQPAAREATSGLSLESTEVLFEQARLLSRRLSRSGNQQAIRLLEECIRRSPENARAHSALALEKLKRFWWHQEDPRLLDEAREKASQALSLDPNLVEARAILAIIKTLESDSPVGYLELADCLKSDRSQPEALAWLSFLFLKGGEFPLAEQIIEKLKRERPDSPYVSPLQAFLLIQRREFPKLLSQIARLKREFPDWDGAAYDEALMGIRMPNLPMLQRAIDDLALLNPEDPSLLFWQSYLKVGQGGSLSATEWESLTPYVLKDHEFAALYAQIRARAGDAPQALKWLEHSVQKGNYDVIQMNHPDFRILENDPAFVNLKSNLQKKVWRLAVQIKPLIHGGRRRL